MTNIPAEPTVKKSWLAGPVAERIAIAILTIMVVSAWQTQNSTLATLAAGQRRIEAQLKQLQKEAGFMNRAEASLESSESLLSDVRLLHPIATNSPALPR
jgi:uncharacterized membrane protein